MRLGGAQLGQVIGERRVTATRPAELVAGTRVDLPVDRLVRSALHDLSGG